MNEPVDYSAFIESDIRSFNGKITGLDKLSLVAGPLIVGFFSLAMTWGLFLPLLLLFTALVSTQNKLTVSILVIGILAILFFAANIFVLWLIYFTYQSSVSVIKLALFATRNHLNFSYKARQLDIPGLIRDSHRSTISGFLIEGSYNSRSFEYQNSWSVRHSYHIISTRIVRADIADKHVELPHILFNCKQNDRLFNTNLPNYFNSKDKILLEGNIDKKFTMYSKADPVTALALISPDVIAIVADNMKNIDIELYLDRVTIIMNWGQPTKETFEIGLKLIDAIRPKIERYFQIQQSRI